MRDKVYSFAVNLFDAFLLSGEWGPFKIGLDSDTVLNLAGDKIEDSKLRKGDGCWLYGVIEFGISDRKLSYIQLDFPSGSEDLDGMPFKRSTQVEELFNYLNARKIPFVEGQPREGPGQERFRIGAGVYAYFNEGELFNLIVSKSSLDEIVPGHQLRHEVVDASGPNTLKNRIERLAKSSNELFIIDVKGSMNREQALQQIRRAEGTVGSLKGRVIILTEEGILRHE